MALDLFSSYLCPERSYTPSASKHWRHRDGVVYSTMLKTQYTFDEQGTQPCILVRGARLVPLSHVLDALPVRSLLL